MTRYGFLGPVGTFTQAALNAWSRAGGGSAGSADVTGDEQVPFASVDRALAGVRDGDVDAAMVPIENSVEGGVSATLDALNTGDPLAVVGEVLVPISFVLAARPGVRRHDVRAVGTHPHGWAQVRGWVGANLPDAIHVPTLSTAAAAADLAAGRVQAYQAAVCARVAADATGLVVLADDIGDRTGAVTRFVLVARPGRLPAPTGADKTTIVVYQYDDHSGGLLELLEQFAARGINISRLESRPTGGAMGSYCFSFDFEGHVLDARVGETLTGLRRVAADVRFLGSYPRADGQDAHVLPTATDDAFQDAAAWLARVRGT